VIKAAAKAAAVSRAEFRVIMAFPFVVPCTLDRATAHTLQGPCQMKIIVVFQ
jgi:hypothetical protein